MRGLNNGAAAADVVPEVTQRSFRVDSLCTHSYSSIKTVLRSPGESSQDSSITIITVVWVWIYTSIFKSMLHLCAVTLFTKQSKL